MRVALVYDRVNKYGGAERVLTALHEMYPDAPLFSAVYDKKHAAWADEFTVHPSFLNAFPFAKTHHELYPWLTPLSFETFSFDAYDVVISVTSAEAKSIITKPETLHICYCLTPIRYLWSGHDTYVEHTGFGALSGIARFLFTRLTPTLRRWDKIASNRPDTYVAISNVVKKRIEKYYKRSVDAVIYPPVDTSIFQLKKSSEDYSLPFKKGSYYLTASRLVPYKRTDIIVDACTQKGLPLLVIGRGSCLSDLKARAGTTVEFIDRYLTDSELSLYHRNCRAFLYAAEEDFGITLVEAQAAGKPVIAFQKGGASEIIENGVTGYLYTKQTKQSLFEAIQLFEKGKHIQEDACRANAKRFDREHFKKEFQEYVEHAYQVYKKSL